MRTLAAVLLALAPLAATAAPCAGTLAELQALLQDPAFPLAWEETSMRDARPLLLTLDERQGGLFLSFVKTGEGLWAEGGATVCRSGDRLEARFGGGQLKVGPAATWLLRQALQNGATVALRRMAVNELRVGAAGWSGSFAPGPPRVGLRAP